MIPDVLHLSPGIYLKTVEYPGKPQVGDRLVKAVRPVISLNGVSYLQVRWVGSCSTNRNGKGKKDENILYEILQKQWIALKYNRH